MASKFLNLSTDNTLGGNSPSDNKAVSEKAIKEYVDNNAGQTYTAGTGLQLSDQNEFNILQEDERDSSIIEIGSPLEVENLVYTNFSTSNYLKVSKQIQIEASDTFEIAIKFKQSATQNGTVVFWGGSDDGSNYLKISLSYSSYKYIYRLQSMGTIGRMKNDITSLNAIEQSTNIYIWLRIRRASLTMYFDYSTDGSTWVNMGSQQIYSSTIGTSLFNFYLGNGADIANYPCTVATIDLNQCYIKVNDITIWDGSGIISKSVAKATDNLYGLVKPDGTSITVNDGVISGNVGTVTSVNNVTPVNGNVSLAIPTVDQTYDSTSSNAQSGSAIAGAGFLQNTAIGTGGLTIEGAPVSQQNCTNIGSNSNIIDNGTDSTIDKITMLGADTNVTVSGTDNALRGGVVIGYGASISVTGTMEMANNIIAIGQLASVTADSAIQIGRGTNSTATTLSIGFGSSRNYQLLDGMTGLIPDARISSNIARTNAIPTESTVSGWGFTKNTGTVTSVNNVQPVNGNVTIETGSSRNIGEIVSSTIPLTDAGLHLLDGALLQYGSYKAFIDYIASIYDASANYFCSEADWQTSVANYGVCDKYVYDSTNNTVRLPKTASAHGGLIASSSSETSWYRIYADGWCEQGGTVTATSSSSNQTIPLIKNYVDTNYDVSVTPIASNATNTLQAVVITKTTLSFTTGNTASKMWRASGYTDISSYQQNPLYEYIVLATTTKTDIQVDIDEIATDLNSKADKDLSNISTGAFEAVVNIAQNSGRETVVGWCMPDYSNRILLNLTASNSFTAPSHGWILGCFNIAGSGSGTIYVNGQEVGRDNNNNQTTTIPVSKGDVVTCTGTENDGLWFHPAKGVS